MNNQPTKQKVDALLAASAGIENAPYLIHEVEQGREVSGHPATACDSESGSGSSASR